MFSLLTNYQCTDKQLNRIWKLKTMMTNASILRKVYISCALRILYGNCQGNLT